MCWLLRTGLGAGSWIPWTKDRRGVTTIVHAYEAIRIKIRQDLAMRRRRVASRRKSDNVIRGVARPFLQRQVNRQGFLRASINNVMNMMARRPLSARDVMVTFNVVSISIRRRATIITDLN